jgi:hypothetical protein
MSTGSAWKVSDGSACRPASYIRVARFFLTQYTKKGKKHTKDPKKLPKIHKVYQMAVIYFKWA